jgi:hypothetical protein
MYFENIMSKYKCQYIRKFIKLPFDYGYYAELETIFDNKAKLSIYFYNDDGNRYWLHISIYINVETKYIYIMDVQGFSLHGLDLNTLNTLNTVKYDINNNEFDVLQFQILSKFYVDYKIKKKDDFIINKSIKKMIYNIIEKPQIINIFKDILPYDIIDKICNENIKTIDVNLEDFKITKIYNYDKFIIIYDIEEINKEWFTDYSEIIKDYVYFE